MNKTSKNLLFGFGTQIITMALSFILPRIILVSFGSEVNGISSTITQIFGYIALLEAGIGNASINKLYKDIAQSDKDGISTTISATRKYFNKCTALYSLCVIIFAIAYPLLVNTEVSSTTIRMIIILQGLSGVVNFCFTNTYSQLLIADGHNYVLANLNLMSRVISTFLQILLIGIGFDIVSVQFSALVATVLKAIILTAYVRKKYPWLTKDSKVSTKILKQRGAFVIHEISTVVFQGTDVFLISAFCSLKEASVYTMYNMIFVSIRTVFGILFKSFDFKLGAEYHRDRASYVKIHDLYETIMSCFVFAIISAVYVVTIPFIALYTKGVNDINYIIPILPLLFSLIHILSYSRMVSSKLITISGKSPNTIPNTIAETIINLFFSILLVNIIGIKGVLLGTIIALLYRTNDMIIYSNVKILKRKPWKSYKILLINSIVFSLVVFTEHIKPLSINNYFDFLVWGFIALVLFLAFYFGLHSLLNKDLREIEIGIFRKIKNKIRK